MKANRELLTDTTGASTFERVLIIGGGFVLVTAVFARASGMMDGTLSNIGCNLQGVIASVGGGEAPACGGDPTTPPGLDDPSAVLGAAASAPPWGDGATEEQIADYCEAIGGPECDARGYGDGAGSVNDSSAPWYVRNGGPTEEEVQRRNDAREALEQAADGLSDPSEVIAAGEGNRGLSDPSAVLGREANAGMSPEELANRLQEFGYSPGEAQRLANRFAFSDLPSEVQNLLLHGDPRVDARTVAHLLSKAQRAPTEPGRDFNPGDFLVRAGGCFLQGITGGGTEGCEPRAAQEAAAQGAAEPSGPSPVSVDDLGIPPGYTDQHGNQIVFRDGIAGGAVRCLTNATGIERCAPIDKAGAWQEAVANGVPAPWGDDQTAPLTNQQVVNNFNRSLKDMPAMLAKLPGMFIDDPSGMTTAMANGMGDFVYRVTHPSELSSEERAELFSGELPLELAMGGVFSGGVMGVVGSGARQALRQVRRMPKSADNLARNAGEVGAILPNDMDRALQKLIETEQSRDAVTAARRGGDRDDALAAAGARNGDGTGCFAAGTPVWLVDHANNEFAIAIEDVPLGATVKTIPGIDPTLDPMVWRTPETDRMMKMASADLTPLHRGAVKAPAVADVARRVEAARAKATVRTDAESPGVAAESKPKSYDVGALPANPYALEASVEGQQLSMLAPAAL